MSLTFLILGCVELQGVEERVEADGQICVVEVLIGMPLVEIAKERRADFGSQAAMQRVHFAVVPGCMAEGLGDVVAKASAERIAARGCFILSRKQALAPPFFLSSILVDKEKRDICREASRAVVVKFGQEEECAESDGLDHWTVSRAG